MTYEVYRYIFLGGLILACLFLALAVVLFFVLKIPRVIGDLTGATARKAIEDIRNQNEESGTKSYKPSAVNRERGKITEKMTRSGKLVKHPSAGIGGHITAKISTQELDVEMLPADETTVLVNEETTVLAPEPAPYAPASETTVLSQPMAAPVPVQPAAVFSVDYEITYIHTQEVIV